MSAAQRFRELNSYARVHGFVGGFPNFQQADYGDGVVYGSYLIPEGNADWQAIPQSEYVVGSVNDVPMLMRAAADLAAGHGAAAAIPTFHRQPGPFGLAFGTLLFRPGTVERRDVLRAELGGPGIDDVPAMMIAADEYATRNGFAAAVPTFHQANHGAGVVYGLNLFHAGVVRWRDLHADLLARYSQPQPKWGVMLCRFRNGVQIGAQSSRRWLEFFSAAGSGTQGAYDFWRDMAYGVPVLENTSVQGWYTIDRDKSELLDLSGIAQRRAAFTWGRDAAALAGVDVDSFDQLIVVVNESSNHGRTTGGVLLGYPEEIPIGPRAGDFRIEASFVVHEMGHALHLPHSFGENPTTCSGDGGGRPGEYCDRFDIMSARSGTKEFKDVRGRVNGPGLNALGRKKLGYLHRSRIWSPRGPDDSATIVLASLDRPDVDGYLMAQFVAKSRLSTQLLPSLYSVEYREKSGWDAGFDASVVLLHELRNDTYIRLLTDFNDGVLSTREDFQTPGGGIALRLLAMDPVAHTATIQFWVPNARTGIRIKQIVFNPPGADIYREHIVLQNDGPTDLDMTDWKLLDAAGHTYTFPGFTLAVGAEVAVWSGKGTNDAVNLYWGRGQAVWNNTGDEAVLYDAQGHERARVAYLPAR